MNITKKIGRSGGITIPSHLRRDLGIQGGEKVGIEVDSNGNITIKRLLGSCIICGENENLRTIGKRFICGNCIAEMKELEVI